MKGGSKKYTMFWKDNNGLYYYYFQPEITYNTYECAYWYTYKV